MKWRVSNWSSKIVGDRIFGWCDTIDEGEGAFGLAMPGSQVHLCCPAMVISLLDLDDGEVETEGDLAGGDISVQAGAGVISLAGGAGCTFWATFDWPALADHNPGGTSRETSAVDQEPSASSCEGEGGCEKQVCSQLLGRGKTQERRSESRLRVPQ